MNKKIKKNKQSIRVIHKGIAIIMMLFLALEHNSFLAFFPENETKNIHNEMSYVSEEMQEKNLPKKYHNKKIETAELDILAKFSADLTKTYDEKKEEAIKKENELEKQKELRSVLVRLKEKNIDEISEHTHKRTKEILKELKKDGVISTLVDEMGEEKEINPELKISTIGFFETKETPYTTKIPLESGEGVSISEDGASAGKKISGQEDGKVPEDLTPFVQEEVRYFSRGAANVDAQRYGNKSLYEEIWENVDLLVTTTEKGIKEDLILKNDKAPTYFDYIIETVGLELEITKDGGLLFLDQLGKEKFYTPSPFIMDANGTEISDGVYFKLGWDFKDRNISDAKIPKASDEELMKALSDFFGSAHEEKKKKGNSVMDYADEKMEENLELEIENLAKDEKKKMESDENISEQQKENLKKLVIENEFLRKYLTKKVQGEELLAEEEEFIKNFLRKIERENILLSEKEKKEAEEKIDSELLTEGEEEEILSGGLLDISLEDDKDENEKEENNKEEKKLESEEVEIDSEIQDLENENLDETINEEIKNEEQNSDAVSDDDIQNTEESEGQEIENKENQEEESGEEKGDEEKSGEEEENSEDENQNINMNDENGATDDDNSENINNGSNEQNESTESDLHEEILQELEEIILEEEDSSSDENLQSRMIDFLFPSAKAEEIEEFLHELEKEFDDKEIRKNFEDSFEFYEEQSGIGNSKIRRYKVRLVIETYVPPKKAEKASGNPINFNNPLLNNISVTDRILKNREEEKSKNKRMLELMKLGVYESADSLDYFYGTREDGFPLLMDRVKEIQAEKAQKKARKEQEKQEEMNRLKEVLNAASSSENEDLENADNNNEVEDDDSGQTDASDSAGDSSDTNLDESGDDLSDDTEGEGNSGDSDQNEESDDNFDPENNQENQNSGQSADDSQNLDDQNEDDTESDQTAFIPENFSHNLQASYFDFGRDYPETQTERPMRTFSFLVTPEEEAPTSPYGWGKKFLSASLLHVVDIGQARYNKKESEKEEQEEALGEEPNDGKIRVKDGRYLYYPLDLDPSTFVSLRPTPKEMVSAGGSHTLALKSDGIVWSWGDNSLGQLGDNQNCGSGNCTKAIQVPGISDIISVSAGENHSLALSADGTVWAWGDNSLGQLGDGKTSGNSSFLAVQVMYLSDVSQIAAGKNFSLAKKSDGTVYAWGNNTSGELGNGLVIQSNIPEKVGILPENISTLVIHSDEISGTTIFSDVSSNEHNIITYGSTKHTNIEKKIGQSSIVFDGSSDYLQIDHTIDFDLTGDFSISLWINPMSITGAQDYNKIINIFDIAGGNGAEGWFLGLGTSGTLDQKLVFESDSFTDSLESDSAIATGTWVHAAIVRKDGNIKMYLDGVAQADVISHTGTILGNNGTNGMWIGSDPAFPEDRNFHGYLDELYIVHGTALWDANFTTPDSSILENISTLSAGGNHALAVRDDGSVFSWGANANGQLGENQTCSNTNCLKPVQVFDTTGTGYLSGITQVSAGNTHSLALDENGEVWAFGENSSGQLGDNQVCSATNCLLPIQTKDITGTGILNEIIQISAGESHSLVLQANSEVLSFGVNDNAQLGDNSLVQKNIPVNVLDNSGAGNLSGIKSISAGKVHSVAIDTDSTIWAWGGNTSGQLGDESTVQKSLPVHPQEEVPIEAGGTGGGETRDFVATGGEQRSANGETHSLVVRYDGTVWAWGSNASGELGDGTTEEKNYPVQVQGISEVNAVAAGKEFSLALKANGTVWAWGKNDKGQLGDNQACGNTFCTSPVQVFGLTDVVSIISGENFSLAIKSDGTLWAWGLNGSGQLGDNSTSQRNTPVQVKDNIGTGFLTEVVGIAAGSEHTLALTADGTLYSWGKNMNGQLGDNTTDQRTLPVGVKNENASGFLEEVIMITAGKKHSAALLSDGSVLAWGDNSSGQIGDNQNCSATNCLLPTAVSGIQNVTYIESGDSHTIVLKSDGSLWGWGANTNGQLGDNSTTQRNIPVRISEKNTDTNQVLLIHSDDADTSINFTDSSDSNHMITANGDVQHATSEKKFGGSAMKFDGTGDYLEIADHADFKFGASDFTLDFWVNYSASGGNQVIYSSSYDETNNVLIVEAESTLRLTVLNGTGNILLTENSAANLNTWHHYGVVRSGNMLTIYRDGVASGNVDVSGKTFDNTQSTPVYFGYGSATSPNHFNGYLDEIRISKGVARWTSDFTPPNTPYGTVKNFEYLSANGNHSTGVRADGTIWKWGENTDGQIGNEATATDSLTPVQVVPATAQELYVEGNEGVQNIITTPTPHFSAIFEDVSFDIANETQVQVDDNSDFSSVLWDSNVISLAPPIERGVRSQNILYDGPALSESTEYFYRIKFIDDEGAIGPWSTGQESFIINASPSEPTNLFVHSTDAQSGNTGTQISISGTTPHFSGIFIDNDHGDKAKQYQIQIDDNSDFSSVFWDSLQQSMNDTFTNERSPDIVYSGSELSAQTEYFFRIKFWDQNGGEGSWSTETVSFITNTTPNAPTLVSPLDAHNTGDTTPDLSANYIDADTDDTGITHYRVASTQQDCLDGTNLLDSGASIETSTENEDTVYTVSTPIVPDGTYYWCAQNDDGLAQSAWTHMGSIIINTVEPDIVSVDAGKDNTNRENLESGIWFNDSNDNTGADSAISFSWTDPNSSTDDTFYYELNTDPNPSIDGTEPSITTDPFVDDVAITEGINYFHVKPKNGSEVWGTERIFEIKFDTTAPTISVDTPNGTEVFSAGTENEILWTATDSSSGITNDNILIEYSLDAGPFTEISNSEENDGTYMWQAPWTESSQGSIKITATDNAGNTFSDESNAYFEIKKIFDTLKISSGNKQIGGINENLKNELKVHVSSSTGGSIEAGDITVTFEILTIPSTPDAEGQNLSAGTFGQNATGEGDSIDIEVDKNGHASAVFQLGDRAGEYVVRASYDQGQGIVSQDFNIREKEVMGISMTNSTLNMVSISGGQMTSETLTFSITSNAASYELTGLPSAFPGHSTTPNEKIENWNTLSQRGFGWKKSTDPSISSFSTLPQSTVMLDCTPSDECQGTQEIMIELYAAVDNENLAGSYSDNVTFELENVGF